jgi:hypothetical protein
MPVNKLWLFHDESGEPGKSDFFITGYLLITSREKQRLLDDIRQLREDKRFFDEFHFQTFSKKRHHVYKLAIDKALNTNMFFKCIVIRRELVDLKRFGNQRYRAYNFFTKLVMFHGLKHRSSHHVHIRSDDKNRLRQDNFIYYLRNQLNWEFWINGYDVEVKSVKQLPSRSCEMVQLTDLFLGAIKCHFEPAGDRKNDVSRFLYTHPQFRHKVNVWDWRPRKL